MEDAVRLGVIVLGSVGILLGLYGLFMPSIQRRLANLKVGRPEVETDIERIERNLRRLHGDALSGMEPLILADVVAAQIPPLSSVPDGGMQETRQLAAGLTEPEPVPAPREEVADVPPVPDDGGVEQPAEPTVLDHSDDQQSPAGSQDRPPIAESEDAEILALFGELAQVPKLPSSLSESLREVDINELFEEATQVRALFSSPGRGTG
jgi:hypothetical protein